MSEIFVILVMIEAGLAAVAGVAFCLSLILFFANRKRQRLGGINTAAMRRAPIICMGIALPCFLMMPLIYKGLKPETFPSWNEHAGEHMSSYDAVVNYQNEEYVRLDMGIDMSQLKQSACKGYLKYMGAGKPSAGEKGRWTSNAVYEIENETGFPLLYVRRLERVGETDVYDDDLYCRRQDKSAFLTACFEGDAAMYCMYQENSQGELEAKGLCSPQEEMGISMDLWNNLYSLEEIEPEYLSSSKEKKPDYFLDAYFMDGLFFRRFHLCYDIGIKKWYCFMDDEQGHQKEQIFKLPKKGQKYMNALAKK